RIEYFGDTIAAFEGFKAGEVTFRQENSSLNWATAYEFRHQMTWDMALHRNAFAEIKEGPRGPIDQLTRLDPELVWIVRGNGTFIYEVRDGNGMTRRLDRDQVFHLRAPPLTSDNILGRSLIEDGSKTFARALALQDYATRFFDNDATPGGAVEVPGAFKTVEQAHDFRRKWQSQFGGRNRHKVAVLDAGAKFKPIDVQNDKAQFIQTYEKVALQVLRFWRMPPHKVGILDRATFSNIEQQSIEFVTETLLPWLVAWEQAIRRDLIVRDRDFFAEHNVAGLLRGDIEARYKAYRIGREWGWLNANDVRSMENMNPIEGGDGYIQPLNMGPAGGATAQRAAFSAVFNRPDFAAALETAIGNIRALSAERRD
ncbi:MAG: phage portal protein, partial [Pseudomonadota bacterium]